jgi:selenide, water dikinase
VLQKAGMKPGDVLVLTKPIGTGTLLAADMRAKAKARWVMAAMEQMTRSNRVAANIVAAHDANAATDITGFGLLGHLVEMVRASDVDATLVLSEIPLLDGLKESIGLGIFSSLQPQNVRLRRAIRNLGAAATHPLYPALFDPQTAGGLLASVPMHRAQSCLTSLRSKGYTAAAMIGMVEARSEAIEPITIELDRRTNMATEIPRQAQLTQEDTEAASHARQPVL